jgi:hypothetical protein
VRAGLAKADEEKLKTFKSRILRRIYGPICENRVWSMKYNNEDLDIVRVITVARLRWLGHLVRMEKTHLAKR